MSSPCSNGNRRDGRTLSTEALELVAERFAVLADPMRLRLLQALFDGEKNVHTLVETTSGTQSNVSRHLQVLLQARLVVRRKAGLEVFYALADATVFKLCELACGSLEAQLARQSAALAGETRTAAR